VIDHTGELQIGDTVIYQKMKDEVVLLNMENQHYYGLDDVAAAMWDRLLTDGNIDSAASSLEKIYNVDPVVLRADLEILVGDLLAAGLLRHAT
jgi:hypothetical protein